VTVGTPPESARRLVALVRERLGGRTRLARQFARCYLAPFTSTIRDAPDGSVFVTTGDIPAMWLRDSAAQVRPYLPLARTDPTVAALLARVVRRQLRSILIDPYANAFNARPDGRGHRFDRGEVPISPWVWERKFELDSHCYPLQLAYLLWRATGSADHLDATFRRAVEAILAVWRREQRHESASRYRFRRLFAKSSSRLARGGRGSRTAETGMVWSGFRPSDDACRFGYLVPANMFAVVALSQLAELADEVLHDRALSATARQLAAEIDAGIRRHGVVEHETFGAIYAYETDGLGHHLLMDDANVPSLLSIPYLGYREAGDPIYRNTRRFALSAANLHFFRGTAAAGIGSPHTPRRHAWPLAIAMQGLTASDSDEREQLLGMLERTDAGTERMHESFHVDNPARFTRAEFGWADALFCELVLAHCGVALPGSA
jgi:meiotically up-regulated gene 157 (Mug157) protein